MRGDAPIFNFILLSLSLLAAATNAGTHVALAEGFNDGRLDRSWSVRFHGDAEQGGWAFGEGGAGLTVSALTDPVASTSTAGRWARVSLSRGFDASLLDFDASFTVAWDEQESSRAVQSVRVRIVDEAGRTLAEGGYLDGWVRSSGSELAGATGREYLSRGGRLAHAGSARVRMSREGQDIRVSFDGRELVRGSSGAAAAGVVVEFGHYAYQTPSDQLSSFFGSVTIGGLRVSGQPTCPADLNADGTQNIFDVLEFFDRFEAESPEADLQRNGRFDVFDLVAFLERYAQPC